MKNKDITWMEDKIQDIKKRKRKLKILQDPQMVKKIKADLKREYRAAKRTERSNINIYIKQEIENFYDK